MNTNRLNNFDLIRLLAAMQVIFNHANGWLKIPVNPYITYIIQLFPGVAVFFIISGFLVTKSYIEGKGNILRYSIGRILRIYPGMWINLSIILLLLYSTGVFNSKIIFNPIFLIQQFLLFSTGIGCLGCKSLVGGSVIYDWTKFYKLFPSGVLWTITVELGFYVMVPIIFINYLKKNIKLFNLVIIVSFVISLFISYYNGILISQHDKSHLHTLINCTVFSYLWIFLFGSLVYLNWNRLSYYLCDRFTYWLVTYILVSLFALFYHNDHVLNFKMLTYLNFIRLMLLALCIVSFAYSLKSLNFLNGKIDLSYGMYLYHMQIIFTLMFLNVLHSQLLWFVVYFGTFFVAGCSWFFIEKPALSLKRQLFKIIKSEPSHTQFEKTDFHATEQS